MSFTGGGLLSEWSWLQLTATLLRMQFLPKDTFFEREIKRYLCSYSLNSVNSYHLFCLLYVFEEHIFWGCCVTAFFLRYLIFFLLRKLIQEIFQDSENAKIQLPDKSPVLLEFNLRTHVLHSDATLSVYTVNVFPIHQIFCTGTHCLGSTWALLVGRKSWREIW